MKEKLKILTNGLLKENPSLRLVLGTCPTLAVTTLAFNGLGMGLAATFVLICSNMAISALRKVIPQQVRIPCYITVIAGFVTVVQMLMKAYLYDLYAALGVFLPLIVVNCIILGRAEMFASKHGVLDSALDGLGMGLGFTLTLTLMGSVRELLGSGTWMAGLGEAPVLDFSEALPPMAIFSKAPGGFFVFGCFMAAAIALEKADGKKLKLGCGACPSAAVCGQADGCEGCEGCGDAARLEAEPAEKAEAEEIKIEKAEIDKIEVEKADAIAGIKAAVKVGADATKAFLENLFADIKIWFKDKAAVWFRKLFSGKSDTEKNKAPQKINGKEGE